MEKNLNIEKSGRYDLNVDKENLEIIIKDNLEVEIYEKIDSNTTINIIVGKNTKVNYYSLEEAKDNLKINRQISVEKSSNLNLKIIGLNNKKVKENILAKLVAEYATFDYKLITTATSVDNKNDYDVRAENHAPKTFANIWQKAVVKNGGVNNFVATGFIEKGSDESENFQESRVLLLDKAGRGEASPFLLIEHYNVLAGHKASVSRVSEEDMYYLLSRGISKKDAEQLLIKAFIYPLIEELTDDKYQEEIIQRMNARLINA